VHGGTIPVPDRWTHEDVERRLTRMARHDPKSRPQTLERPAPDAEAPLAIVAREVSHGRTTLVLSRDFASGRDSVWRLLTEPDYLRQWAPYTADRNLSQVGRCVLTMLGPDGGTDVEIPSVVLVADSPALLEHSWASDMLAWHVTTIGAAGRLTLHQTLADETMASANAAGWHLCLDVADSVLAGNPIPPMRGMEAMQHGWRELNGRYATALGVAPSRVA
jgi:uncharacterized protein YndB with AHSA1/START domain